MSRIRTVLAAVAIVAGALATGGSASATATMPVPVTGYITTYTGGPLAVQGTYCPQVTGACATVTLHPETGATFYWQLGYPDGHVASGHTASVTLRFRPLASGSLYGLRERAVRHGYASSAWSAWVQVDTRTCALPQPYGPEPDIVARTSVWDRTSWLDWTGRYTPGEFSNTLEWLNCEADSSQVSDWYTVQYISAADFTVPLNGYVGIWHLAVPLHSVAREVIMMPKEIVTTTGMSASETLVWWTAILCTCGVAWVPYRARKRHLDRTSRTVIT